MRYHRPETLSDAVAALAESGGRPLAGGTDLLVRAGRETDWPEGLVDIKRLPELQGLVENSDGLRLGAALRLSDLGRAPELTSYPALAEVCRVFAGRQICERATVGGNLANASPAADTVPALIVYGGRCHTDRRVIPIEKLATGPGKTVLERDEIIVAVTLPAAAPHTLSFFHKLASRDKMAIAIVGVAACLEMEGKTVSRARIALGSVAPKVIRARTAEKVLEGGRLNAETISRAARAVIACAKPIDDIRASAEYRSKMCGRLLKYRLTRLADR